MGTWIGWIVKTFDYINRVNLTISLSVYEGTWTHSPPLVAMLLLDRPCMSVGFFLKLHAMFPNTSRISSRPPHGDELYLVSFLLLFMYLVDLVCV